MKICPDCGVEYDPDEEDHLCDEEDMLDRNNNPPADREYTDPEEY